MAKPMSRKDRFREWVSDNLRYMLLILAILVVVGIILLIVHLVSSGSGKEEEKGKPEVTSSSVKDTSSDSVEEQKEETEQEFTAENNAQVSVVANTYFTALAAKDLDTVRKSVDTLSAEDQTQIEEEDKVESYHDITTYTLDGPKEGTYIAFVSYNCKYKDIATQLPMLVELYMYTNADGNLVIASDTESDPEISEAMNDALQKENVKALVGNVNASYEQAMESDAELKAYVESIQ